MPVTLRCPTEQKHLQGFTWPPLPHPTMIPPVNPFCRGTTSNKGDQMTPGMWSCYKDHACIPFSQSQVPPASCERSIRDALILSTLLEALWQWSPHLLALYFASLLPLGIHQWEPTHAPPHHHKVWPLSNTQLYCFLPYTKLEPGQLQNAKNPSLLDISSILISQHWSPELYWFNYISWNNLVRFFVNSTR